MKCLVIPGALPPSPGAVSEVDVSEEVYLIGCDQQEAQDSCCEHLIGKRLRIILGPKEVRHLDSPQWVNVMPEDGDASYSGVRRSYLRQI